MERNYMHNYNYGKTWFFGCQKKKESNDVDDDDDDDERPVKQGK